VKTKAQQIVEDCEAMAVMGKLENDVTAREVAIIRLLALLSDQLERLPLVKEKE